MRSIPILLLTFNRPDTTRIVFESIRKTKPTKLYIAQDGPRNKEDIVHIEEVRNIFSIDRECNIQYLMRERNLWCLEAVTQAIDRFFSYEEFGIILEDDCMMWEWFPLFCSSMDDLYRWEWRIGTISWSNYIRSSRQSDWDYFFSSHHPLLWWWATWRDRWQYYSNSVELIDQNRPSSIKRYTQWWYWDSDRYATLLNRQLLTIVPSINFIANIWHIGIHNQRAGSFHDLPIGILPDTFPIFHKKSLTINKKYDKWMESFILKLYLYAKIEILLKKIWLYRVVHRIFLCFITLLAKTWIR